MNRSSFLRLLLLILVCLGVIVASDAASLTLHLTPITLVPPPQQGEAPSITLGPKLGTDFPAGVAGALFEAAWLSLLSLVIPNRTRRLARAVASRIGDLLRLEIIGLFSLAMVAAIATLGLVSDLSFGLPVLAIIIAICAGISLTGITATLGHTILKRLSIGGLPAVGEVAIGALVLYVACNLPFIGLVLLALVNALAVGLALVTRVGSTDGWQMDLLLRPSSFTD